MFSIHMISINIPVTCEISTAPQIPKTVQKRDVGRAKEIVLHTQTQIIVHTYLYCIYTPVTHYHPFNAVG